LVLSGLTDVRSVRPETTVQSGRWKIEPFGVATKLAVTVDAAPVAVTPPASNVSRRANAAAKSAACSRDSRTRMVCQ